MPLQSHSSRFLLLSTLLSLFVLLACGTAAIYLNRQQSLTADALGENIGSRGAAFNLEATLADLIALHAHGSQDVEPLLRRADEQIAAIRDFADKPRETELAHAIETSFTAYRDRRPGTPGPLLADWLREHTLAQCQELRAFNGRQLEQSERDHRRSLQGMTWGLAAVGGLGSVAGLVLGYALARSLRRTMHQFLVRIQGASDRLGQELPAVEWQREGDPVKDGAEDFVRRVEQAVLTLQQKEREVRRAERLAAVGQLAAGVAHEVRNPLTSVLLLLEAARRGPHPGGLTDEDLDLIESELHRIERSLQTFLDYARPPRLERAPTDLAALLRDTLALVRTRAEQQAVALRLHLPDAPVVLSADRDQLRQVVLNLALNALDAMPTGGALTLTVAPPHDGRVDLTVADTGPGIAPDILPRLFEPFATGKETGVGLGLVVSRRIAEDHGGALHGANAPVGGAAFTLRLPAAAPPAAPNPGDTHAHAPAHR